MTALNPRRFRPLVLAFVVAAALAGPVAADEASRRRPDALDGRYVVVYRDGVARPGRLTARLAADLRLEPIHRYGAALGGFSARLSPAQVERLRRHPGVDLVVPDLTFRAVGSVPLAAGDSAPSGVRRVGAATSSTVREASPVNVAIVDTGIDLSHPDLAAQHGVNCLGTGPAADDNGHGTHVAGTIAARNDGRLVTGIAPGTKVHAVKVLNSSGSGSTSSIVCGIDWITATRTDADPANDIAVANMSLGGTGTPVRTCATTTDPMHLAVCRATAAGVTVVVAAGNKGWDFDYASAPDVPAAYPEVLTVTAISDSDGAPGGTGGAPACRTGEGDDAAATFSNYAATTAGAAHTVAAPGTCIRSDVPGGGTGLSSGTSMAAPHVAGLVALCIAEGSADGPCAGQTPAQNVETIRSVARQRTTDMPAYGFAGDPTRPVNGRYYGYLGWAPPAPAPTPEPTPSDTTAPVVASLVPADGATGVPTSAAVAISFSEEMDRATSEAAFGLTAAGGSPISGTFSWSGTTMTFRPAAALPAGAWLTARVGTGARDLAGNPLEAGAASTFRTAASYSASPGSVTIQQGSLRGGGPAQLTADDNSYLMVNSTTRDPRTATWYGTFSDVPNALSNLQVTYRGKHSRTVSQSVWIRNTVTGAWVQLDSRSVGTSEVEVVRIPSGSPGDYVTGTTGDGVVKVQIRATDKRDFWTSADLLRISFTA